MTGQAYSERNLMKRPMTTKAKKTSPVGKQPTITITTAEYKTLKATSLSFERLMFEVEDLFGVDILPNDCDLAKLMPKFRKTLAKLRN